MQNPMPGLNPDISCLLSDSDGEFARFGAVASSTVAWDSFRSDARLKELLSFVAGWVVTVSLGGVIFAFFLGMVNCIEVSFKFKNALK